MLNVPHFGQSPFSKIYMQQILTLVLDGCIWLRMRIPIDEMFIKIITTLPYRGKDPIDEFMGKNKYKEIAQVMKEKFGLGKKFHRYEINSIEDQGVCFTAHILVGKIMRKCRANEVLATVVSLV